jgi:hypothetical protein
MRSGNVLRPDSSAAPVYQTGGRSTTNLGDILERVLDKGIVIAGDIQVNLLDIELLTIKLRLVVASLDTARQVGINWWEADPWLSADAMRREMDNGARNRDAVDQADDLEAENRRLRARVRELESGGDRPRSGEPRK